jgi:NifU-like protein involved in Fe-S cluster formation
MMSEVRRLLEKSGYSSKAIEYYLKKVNVGRIEKPSVHLAYTGPCGDSMEVYLKIESDVIKDAKFQAIGCAGAFSAGSALMKMVKGKALEEAVRVTEEDIINFLGGIPKQKIHCACLAKRTLEMAINKYRRMKTKTDA